MAKQSKISVVPDDKAVYVDGKSMQVDCSDLPTFIHAIQWDGKNGHIEFKSDGSGRRMPNITFTDFTPYQFLVDRWNRANDEIVQKTKVEEEERKKQVKEIQEQTRKAKKQKVK